MKGRGSAVGRGAVSATPMIRDQYGNEQRSTNNEQRAGELEAEPGMLTHEVLLSTD